jgi:transmembrane sensor
VHINKDTLHISPSERFIVHCGSLNIEVLGTTFNVKARRGITDIALVTGKIRVNYAQQDVAGKSVVMAPGDYIQYTAKRVMTARKIARPARIAVWKNDEISFTDASLKEIVETLEDNFGYAVSMKDSSLLALKIEGDISVGNVADLLDVVRTTLGVRIIQSSGKRINIDRK